MFVRRMESIRQAFEAATIRLQKPVAQVLRRKLAEEALVSTAPDDNRLPSYGLHFDRGKAGTTPHLIAGYPQYMKASRIKYV